MEAKYLSNYKNEYTIFTQYEKKIAKDKWAKANMGNTKKRNTHIFDGTKFGVAPNDGYPARQPPVYYNRDKIYK